MRYIKLFEKWGIDKSLEDLTDEYMRYIKKNPDKNEFNLVFYHELGNYVFKVKINDLGNKKEGNITYDVEKVNGKERISNFVITLSDRNDRSTLLHELKHFDRLVRVGSDKSVTRTVLKWTNHIDNDFNPGIKSLFYLLNDDEFEAKYHGYYSKIDEYLQENLIDNPTREDVINQINFFLKLPTTDKSYTWWKSEKYIKFSNYGDEKYVEKVFDLLINGEITPMVIPSLNMRELYKSVKTYLRQKLGIKTKLEKEQISKAINFVEKLINKNKEKYRKKFNRIYSIMVDKYVN